MRIYYSVQNCGDGSAYPLFLSTQELADWDQERMDEGWGEPCVGSLEILTQYGLIIPDMMDAISYWLHRTEDEGEDYGAWELRDEFLAEFFPDGLPRFEVRINGFYYDIYVDGVKKGRRLGWDGDLQGESTTEAGRAALERRLNA